MMRGRKSQQYMSHVQKNFKIQTLIKYLLTKNQILAKLPKFHMFKKIVILKYNWNFLDQPHLEFKFHDRDM